jgi:hypothetical protein
MAARPSNASAEFTGSHPARVHAHEIRSWISGRIEELLRALDHREPRACALDGNDRLSADFQAVWDELIDDGLIDDGLPL